MFSCTSKRRTWSIFITMVFEHTVQCDYNLHAWMCHQVFRYNSVVIWLRFQICCNKCCYIRVWSLQEKNLHISSSHNFVYLPNVIETATKKIMKQPNVSFWVFFCQYYISHGIERFLNTLFLRRNVWFN